MDLKQVIKNFLDEVFNTITQRQESYNSPIQNFQDIADVWTIQMRHKLKEGAKFESEDVSLMMIAIKLLREKFAHKRDNLVDIVGYVICSVLIWASREQK